MACKTTKKKKTGKGSTSSFTIIPMDKNKFRNEKAKALSKKALLKYLNQAFPSDVSDDDDYEDDEDDYDDSHEKPNTKKKNASEDDWDDEDEEYEEGFDFGDEDSTIYEVECACGNIIDFDEETLEKGSIVCPNCGETLEFSVEDVEE